MPAAFMYDGGTCVEAPRLCGCRYAALRSAVYAAQMMASTGLCTSP
jgi:hypothetical protein